MNSTRKRLTAIALALSASLLLASAASGAQGGPPDLPDHVLLPTARAHGTNDYRVTVGGGGNRVSIYASQGHASVSYSVKGRAGGKRLRADFGDLGFVNMTFHARDRTARGDDPAPVPVPCDSDRTRQPGVWKGEFQFVGEGAFTSVSATKLRGKVETISFDCETSPTPPRAGRPPEAPTLFNATSFVPETRTRTYVYALRSDFQHISKVSAAVFVRRGQLQAGYNIDRNVPRSAMRVHRRGTRFHLEGIAPFSGDGRFNRRLPQEEQWTGDLAVTLPVIGPVALTGPGFKAGLRD